jgi:anti-sigma B factor antagonist
VSELADIAVERYGEATLARLTGEVDMSNASHVSSQLTAAAEGASGPLIVDLTETVYLDSAWFRVLEDVALAMARARRPLRLVCAAGAPTRRLLELAGIDRLLPLFASPEAALSG